MDTNKEIFDFPVQRIPLYADVNGTQIKSDRDAIVRLDSNELIGYVSAEEILRASKGTLESKKRAYYKVIPHTELVTEARKAIKEFGLKPTEHTVMLNNGGRLFHTFNFPQEQIEVAKGDFISMRLTLKNSYDLSSLCGWELGGLRQVCTNGLIAFRKAFFELRKHAGGFRMEDTINSLKNAIIAFNGDVKNFYGELAQTPISLDKGHNVITELMKKGQLPEKYGQAVHTVWENPDRANTVIPDGVSTDTFKIVMATTALDQAKTLWTLYNAFTLILTHYVASVERRMLIHDFVQKKMMKVYKGE